MRALWQVNADYTLLSQWGSDLLNHPNSAWQSGDGRFRCDMFVEYVYGTVLGQDFDGVAALQTPRATYYAQNATDVTVVRPTVQSASFSGAPVGSITVNFSQLMSRGTVDPAIASSMRLVGSISGEHQFDVSFESDAIRSDLFVWNGKRHDFNRGGLGSAIWIRARGDGHTQYLVRSEGFRVGIPLASAYATSWQVTPNDPAEIEVKQHTTLIVDNGPSFDFGSVQEGSGGRELIFTINNLLVT